MALALADATAAGAAPELIIVSSPHPWVWRPLVRQVGRRIKMIFEERDIWPLSLVDLAGQPPWSPLVLWLGFIVRRIYREADAVISLLPDAEPFLQRQGLPPGRFVWIPNGVDPAVFGLAAGIKAPPRHVDALAAARRDGRLAVIYAGSMGPPNWLESILALAEVEARGNRPYHFFLMGDGVSRKKLEAGAAGLDFITFLPPVRREEAWAVTKEADLGYQSSPDVPIIQYGLSLNKIFDYFMLGKPVLSVVRPGRHPVGLAGAGFEVSPGDPAALDRVLREAASMPRSQLASLGDRGRRYALEHHNWQTLGRQYARVCEMVAAGAPLDDSKPGYAILQWSG
jgi:glycosyltransferase involved in cell wall biosynthesis